MAEHCWHSDGIVLTSNPPQHPETCCNCGDRRILTSRYVADPGHGPFARKVQRQEPVIRGGEGPCEPREKD